MDVCAINLSRTVSVSLLIIAGLFGNGEERKNKLTKAGYDPNVVQECVNELLPIIKKYGD